MMFSDPPEIEVEKDWVHTGEGREAELVCIVHAEPPAEVILRLFRYSISYMGRRRCVPLPTFMLLR